MTTNDPFSPLTASVDQARRILGCGSTKLWELIRTHQLDSFKLDNKRLVLLRSVHELIERKRQDENPS